MFDLKIILYIIFGLLPSLVWLSIYLTKDNQPEPKKVILRIFLWGMLVTSPVFFIQVGLKLLLDQFFTYSLLSNLIYWFLIIAFSEEFFKYLVLRLKIINSLHLDEPVDVMIYMVISALGFAGLENILYLFAPSGTFLSLNEFLNRALIIAFIRFVGATFLHTLCSAIVGYFVAISFTRRGRGFTFTAIGILSAVLLHGFYDFFIMQLEGYAKIVMPSLMILIMAFAAFFLFSQLRKRKGICMVN